ncbi:MAG: putative outer membrane protein [Polaromonas sp.]|nr:putative outer membrane protein [Polaromonas sp.]
MTPFQYRLPAAARLAGLLVTLALPALVQAQAQNRTPLALPLWEIGGVGLAVSQQAYPGSSQRVNRGLVLPYLVYRGPLLRADRDTVGLRAYKSPTLELDVGFAAALGSKSDDTDVRRGMPDIGTLVEFGPRLKWNLADGPDPGRIRAEFALRGVYDISDSFSYKGISFEPRLIYETQLPGGWRLGTNAGLVMGNKRLGETFYGVAPQYATALRPAYAADGGRIAWRLGANVSREITPHLRFFGFARFDTVSGAANAGSPLVQRKGGATVGAGLVYSWVRSETLVSD